MPDTPRRKPKTASERRKEVPKGSFFAATRFTDEAIARVLRNLRESRAVELSGPAGSGKSLVLGGVAARLRARRGHRVAEINMGGPRAPEDEAALWRDVAAQLLPGQPETHAAGDAAVGEVRARLIGAQGALTLLIDQSELTDGDWLIEALSHAIDASPRVSVVVASVEALEDRPIRPLHRFMQARGYVELSDARPEALRYWRWYASSLPKRLRSGALEALMRLTDGDPYQTQALSEFLIRQGLGRPRSVRKLVDMLDGVRGNPSRVVPLLRLFVEEVEATPAALALVLRLLDGGSGASVPAADVDAIGVRHAPSWRGFLRLEESAWAFKSEFAEQVFVQEFQRHPERASAALLRHGDYEAAVARVSERRQRFRGGQDALITAMTAWVHAASAPSEAWQSAARAMALVFGEGTRVLRFSSWRGGPGGEGAFFEVLPGRLEQPVADHVVALLQKLFVDKANQSHTGVMTHFAGDHGIAPGTTVYVHLVTRDHRPYAAVLIPTDAYLPRGMVDGSAAYHDYVRHWEDALHSVFVRVREFEEQVIDLDEQTAAVRNAQAQLSRGREGVEPALWWLLTGVTGGFGLAFNRAVLLRRAGGLRLKGLAAIGYHTQAEQDEAWKAAPLTVAKTEGEKIRLDATPLGREVGDCFIEDWQQDPVLRVALASASPTPVPLSTLQASALGRLFAIDGERTGLDNPAVVVPLMLDARLLGVLVVDKPFADHAVTQAQFDALGGMAFQLALTLRTEDEHRRRDFFDALSAIGHAAHSYQTCAEEIASTVMAHLKDLVARVVISTWESGRRTKFDDRMQFTDRVALGPGDQHALTGPRIRYLDRAAPDVGPVLGAQFAAAGELDIPNYPAWVREHQTGDALCDALDAVAVLSIAFKRGNASTGVMAFISTAPAGFDDEDRALLRRVANRAANLLAIARQDESLHRSRLLTGYLQDALVALVKPTSEASLHETLLDQMCKLLSIDTLDTTKQAPPASAALIELNNLRPASVLTLQGSEAAAGLVRQCTRVVRYAIEHGTAVVEYAGEERLARRLFGSADCDALVNAGMQASVWAVVAGRLLLVLSWPEPRRVTSAERRALTLLSMIAGQTTASINAERQRFRTDLADSLKIGDYELIEAEQTHQWNRRLRIIRTNTAWAISALNKIPGEPEVAGALSQLERVTQEAEQAQQRLAYGTFKAVQAIDLSTWLPEVVADWRSVNDDCTCLGPVVVGSNPMPIKTRPVVLRWILNELLHNAKEAEAYNPIGRISVAASLARNGDSVIHVDNTTPLPPAVLAALREPELLVSRRGEGRGRGLWIASRQIRVLLSGEFVLPASGERRTRFTLRLPPTIEE